MSRKLIGWMTVLCLVLPTSLFARTYAEVMIGIASPFGLSTFQDFEAEQVSPGQIGSALTIAGLMNLNRRIALSPSYSYLTTGGNVDNAPPPYLPRNYDIKFQQNELALDLLWYPPGMTKFSFGPGMSASWWFASEKIENPVYHIASRVTKGQSFIARGVFHVLLRSPEATGFSLKVVTALPLTHAFRIKDTAATGYVGVNLGFSMIVH